MTSNPHSHPNPHSRCSDETSVALCLQWLQYRDVIAASGVCKAWRAAAGRHDILSSLHSQCHLFLTIVTDAEVDRLVCTLYSGIRPLSSSMPVPSMLSSLRSSPLLCHVPRVIVEWVHEAVFMSEKPRKERWTTIDLNIDSQRMDAFPRLLKQAFDDAATLSDVSEVCVDARFLLIPAIATHPLMSRAKKLTIDIPRDWESESVSGAGSHAQSQSQSESESAAVQHASTSTSPSVLDPPQLLHATLVRCTHLAKLNLMEMGKPGSIVEGIQEKQYLRPTATDKIRQLLMPASVAVPTSIPQLDTDSTSSSSSSSSSSSVSAQIVGDSSLHSLPLLRSLSAFCLTESSRCVVLSVLTTPLARHLREIDIRGDGITPKQLSAICRGKLIMSENGNVDLDDSCVGSMSNAGTGHTTQLAKLEKLVCELDLGISDVAPFTPDAHAQLMEDVSAVALLPRLRVLHIKPRVRMATKYAFTLQPLILALRRQHQHQHQHSQAAVRKSKRLDRNDNGDVDVDVGVHGNGNGNGNGDDGDGGDGGDEGQSHSQSHITVLQYLQEVAIELPQPPSAAAPVTLTSQQASHTSSTAWLCPSVADDEKFSLPNLTKATITLTPTGTSAAALSHHAPNLQKLSLHISPADWHSWIEEYVYEHIHAPRDALLDLPEWLQSHRGFMSVSDEEKCIAMRHILQRWIRAQGGSNHSTNNSSSSCCSASSSMSQSQSSSSSISQSSGSFLHLTDLELIGWDIHTAYGNRFQQDWKTEEKGEGSREKLPNESPVSAVLPVLISAFPSLRRIHCPHVGDYSFTHEHQRRVEEEVNDGNDSSNGKSSSSSNNKRDSLRRVVSAATYDSGYGWTLHVERFKINFPGSDF